MIKPRQVSILILIICLGATLRLLYAWWVPNEYSDWPDSQNYVSIAKNLVNNFEFANSWTSGPANDGEGPVIDMGDVGPTSFREPLYPVFLALKFKLLGESARTTFLVQALLGTLAIPLCFWVAVMLLPARAALFTAFFQSINPYHIYYTSMVATENISILILLSLIVVAVRVLKITNGETPIPARDILLLALLSGAGILTHSVLVTTVLVTFIFIFGSRYHSSRIVGVAVRTLGMLGLLTLMVVTPWFVRNYLLWNKLVYQTAEGRTLVDGFNDLATGGNEFTVSSNLSGTLDRERYNEVKRSAIYRQNALNWIRDHPRRAIYLAIKKQLFFWSPVPGYVEGYQKLLGGAWGFTFLSLSVIGVCCIEKWSVPVSYLLAVIVGYSLVYSLAIGATRYRVPLESVLAIFAGLGTSTLLPTVGLPRRTWPDILEK